jgi:hypothetical protein
MVAAMSADARDWPDEPLVSGDASPREIRAALLPEETAAFDRAWRSALAEAADRLDLSGVFETLAQWRRIAWSTRSDPEGHRRMLAHAERALRSSEQPAGTVSWDQLKADLSLPR